MQISHPSQKSEDTEYLRGTSALVMCADEYSALFSYAEGCSRDPVASCCKVSK